MNINKKKGGFRGVKRKSLKEDFKIPNVINYNKIAKEGLLSENTEIVTNSLVKRVISVIGGKNQVKSDITPDKKTRLSNNPFTDEFVNGLTRGILNKNSLIKNSFLEKTIKFDNNGVITNCFVTLDKIGYRFGDFTYDNELVQKINKKIDQKLHAKEKTSTLKKNKKRIKFPHDLLVDIKDYKKVFKKGVWDKSVVIQKGSLGKTLKFYDDGMITNCFITREKVGFKFSDFTYDKELMKGVNKKIEQKLNEKKPKDMDINVVDVKGKNLKKEVKDDEISPKSDDLTPRYRNRQKRKPRKPREKREPKLKKEPWEYEGKSFLEKYNEKK